MRLPLAEPMLQLIRDDNHERQADQANREPHGGEFVYHILKGILLLSHLDHIEDRHAPRDEQVDHRKQWDDPCDHHAAGLQSIGFDHVRDGSHGYVSIHTVSRGDREELGAVVERTETRHGAIVNHISFIEETGGGRVVERGGRVEDTAAALFQGHAMSVQPSPWDGAGVHGLF